MATETAVDVVMPQMGVSVSEGTITRWLKQEGEQVEADEPQAPAPAAPQPAAAPPAATAPSGNGKAFISPVVARIAGEHGIDPSQVPGTGAGGRVTKKDILAFVEAGAPTKAKEAEAAP